VARHSGGPLRSDFVVAQTSLPSGSSRTVEWPLLGTDGVFATADTAGKMPAVSLDERDEVAAAVAATIESPAVRRWLAREGRGARVRQRATTAVAAAKAQSVALAGQDLTANLPPSSPTTSSPSTSG
jgi:hypothetical protein